MKKQFSCLTQKGRWLLATLTLLFSLSIGQMWGADYTLYQATSSGVDVSNTTKTGISVTFNSFKAITNSPVTTVANATYGIEAGLKAPRWGGGGDGKNIKVTVSENYTATITAYVQTSAADKAVTVRSDSESGTAVASVNCEATETVYQIQASNLAAGDYYIKAGNDKVGLIKLVATVSEASGDTKSSAKKLLSLKFNNGFDAFINESAHTVTAYYLSGTEAPSITSHTESAKASYAISGNTITITAEDETTQEYALTLTAVEPYAGTGEAETFTGSETYIKTGYAYSSGCWRFQKNADDGRIQEGRTRLYFFVGACQELKLTSGGDSRNMKVYRNGTELATPTASGSNGTTITIAGSDAPAIYGLVSNQTSGDAKFSAIQIVPVPTPCTKPDAPAELGVDSKTYNSVSLSWDGKSAGANGYKIALTSATGAGTFDWKNESTAIYQATGLTPETAYTFKVLYKGVGEGICEVSDTVSVNFTTEAAPVPDYVLINQSTGAVNTAHFRTTSTTNSKDYTVEGTDFAKYIQLGGAYTSPVGYYQTEKVIAYDAETNDVTVEAWVYNKASSDYKFYISIIEEGAEAPTIQEYTAPKNTGKKFTKTFTPSTNATIYFSVGNNSNVFICQVGIYENGTDLKKGGEIGYSVNLSTTRFADNKFSTALKLDGIEYLATSNSVKVYDNNNPVKLKSTSEYIKFTLTGATQVLINASGTYSVTTSAAYDSEKAISNNQAVDLEEGTYYICPNGSNVIFESLSFAEVPVSAAPVFTSPASQPEDAVYEIGNTISPLTVEATGYPAPTYQWYSNSSASVEGATTISGAKNTSYTPSNAAASDLYYYCVASNTLGKDTTYFFHVTVNEPVGPSIICDTTAMTLTSTAVVTDSKKFSFSGLNLGETAVTLELASDVAGLTLSESSVTPTAGAITNKEITVSYKSLLDVAAATVNLYLKQGETTLHTIALTYSSTAGIEDLTSISATTTWDWKDAANTAYGTLGQNDMIVLVNAPITWDANFKANAIAGKLQHYYRDSKYAQGDELKFNTTLAGKVYVTYSNTGGNAARTVNVNGTKGSLSSDKSDVKREENFSVNAGDVLIKGVQVSDDAAKMLRYYEVRFVAAHNVTFANGGTIEPLLIVEGESAALPAVAAADVPEGKAFAGWYIGEDKIGDAGDSYTMSGTADVELTAHYVDLFNVYYYPNGGTGTAYTDVAPAKVAKCFFEPAEGKLFDKWTVDAEGEGTAYQPGDAVSATMNLYAQWKDDACEDRKSLIKVTLSDEENTLVVSYEGYNSNEYAGGELHKSISGTPNADGGYKMAVDGAYLFATLAVGNFQEGDKLVMDIRTVASSQKLDVYAYGSAIADAYKVVTILNVKDAGIYTYTLTAADAAAINALGYKSLGLYRAEGSNLNPHVKSIEITGCRTFCTDRQTLVKVTMKSNEAKADVSGYNNKEYAGDAILNGLAHSDGNYNTYDFGEGEVTGYKLATDKSAILATLAKGGFQEGDRVIIAVTAKAGSNKLPIYAASDKDHVLAIADIDAASAGIYTYTLTAENAAAINALGYKSIGAYRGTYNPYVYSVEVTGCRDWTAYHTLTFKNIDGTATIAAPVLAEGAYASTVAPAAPDVDGKKFLGWSESIEGDVVELTTYTITADATLYAVYGDCPTVGTIFKFAVATGKTNGNIFATTPNSMELTTENYLASVVDCKVVAAVSGSDNNRIQYNDSKGLSFTNGGQGSITITFDCLIAEGDVVRCINYANTNNKLQITGDNHSVLLDGNGAETIQEFDVPAQWDGLKELVLSRGNNTPKFTYFEVKRLAKYTVSFNMMGHGSAIADIENVLDGHKISAPTAPTDENYSFGGWYKENTLENEWNFASDVVTADTTLYAKWLDKSDATLKSLKYGDTDIALEAGVYTYSVSLPPLATTAPALTAVANNPNATVVIFNVGELDSEGQATSTVTVTPEVGDAQVYTVNFSKVHIYDELVPVTASTTWNWTGSVEATIDDVANKGVILANYILGDNFEKIEGKEGERARRNQNGGVYQGTRLHFTTTVPGWVKIYFRAPSSGENCTITVKNNGNDMVVGTRGNSFGWSEKVLVNGDVVIEMVNDKEGGGDTRVQQIEFNATPDHERNVVVGNMGTVCLPNPSRAFGVKVYELAGKIEGTCKVQFDELGENEVLAAGKSYVLIMTDTKARFFYTNTESPVSEADWSTAMKGNLDNEPILFQPYDEAARNVVFFKDNAMWNAFETGLKVTQYRAYLQYDEVTVPTYAPAPGRRRVTLGMHGEQVATGIDAINASEKPMKIMIDGQIYILRGEKVYDTTGRLVK